MRREFLKKIAALPVLAAIPSLAPPLFPEAEAKTAPAGAPRLKTSLNAYSFNDLLRSGSLTLEALLEFCAESGFDGVDLTGYYVPGYPQSPQDAVIYRIKRKAFSLGLEISGTGVRNDFTLPAADARRAEVALVQRWIEVAAKLGAPVIRIFAGKQDTGGHRREEVTDWMVRDISECVSHGERHGVIVAIQNHNDFLRTAAEAVEIVARVNSPWFGLILDTGSFQAGDPYEQIALAAPRAVSWQIKERIVAHGVEQPIDLDRIVAIIRQTGYRGYLPIETLGAGDPREKVRGMLRALNSSLGR